MFKGSRARTYASASPQGDFTPEEVEGAQKIGLEMTDTQSKSSLNRVAQSSPRARVPRIALKGVHPPLLRLQGGPRA